ncbi:MAG: RDD family protein [Idiomarina sp.]|nr:RDD family protein [Idiomarina sp.]
MPNPEHANFPRAGFARRMGAILYDLLAIAAVLMLAAGAALGVVSLVIATGLVTLAEGADHASVLEGNWLYTMYLLAVIFGFYAGFWVRGGQTLGMRAWRLKVQNTDGSCISWRQAAIRFATAALGLSNIGVLFDKDELAWQDRAAKTEVVILSPEANKFKNWKPFK